LAAISLLNKICSKPHLRNQGRAALVVSLRTTAFDPAKVIEHDAQLTRIYGRIEDLWDGKSA